MVPGLVLNDSVTPIIRTKVKEPPVMINPEDLGGSTAAGKTFTMGVRLKSPNVSMAMNKKSSNNILIVI